MNFTLFGQQALKAASVLSVSSVVQKIHPLFGTVDPFCIMQFGAVQGVVCLPHGVVPVYFGVRGGKQNNDVITQKNRQKNLKIEGNCGIMHPAL